VNLDAFAGCLSSASCLITQTSAGLIIGMLLFLVACGVTLIFGVLGVINFAHGAFYMLGAYLALTAYQLTDSYLAAVLCAAVGVGLFGVAFDRLFMSRVYNSNVLMQLLVCYAFVLILDDAVKMIWGAEFQSMGMPAAFALRPLHVLGGLVPPFYVFLVAVTIAIALALGGLIERTLFGKIVRAAAVNRQMVSALGINTSLLYASVFGLGALLAGAAGALAAPVRSATPGMGVSILIESFIVTVIGGMGSIAGAFTAAVLLGLVRSFGSIGFPLFTDGLMFGLMVIVLLIRPQGLFARGSA